MDTECTKKEKKKLQKNICPDYGKKGFLEGPHGGMSINIMCANEDCKSRFNVFGMGGKLLSAERI